MGYLIGGNSTSSLTATEYAASGVGFGLGDRRTDGAGNTYVYIQASASLNIYDCVRIKSDYKAAQMTLDTAKQAVEVGFVQVAFELGNYGWAMVTGRPTVKLAAACEKQVALYATATGGVLDDATVSTMIQGVVATTSSTNSAAGVACVAQFPTIQRSANLTQI
jgi:hypothetical protein